VLIARLGGTTTPSDRTARWAPGRRRRKRSCLGLLAPPTLRSGWARRPSQNMGQLSHSPWMPVWRQASRASSDPIGRYRAMVSNDHAPSITILTLPRLTGWGCAPALLALLMVSGCEALERMDYLDRFFEPTAYARPIDVSERRSIPLPNLEGDPRSEVLPSAASLHDPAQQIESDPTPQHGPVRTLKRQANQPSLSGEDRDAWTRRIVRENRWLTQFWAELTPAQQLRIERRMQRGTARLAGEHTEPEAIWDTMGLADRARVAFGDDSPSDHPEPIKTSEPSVLVDRPSSGRRRTQ
jgi:hypothetical protein